MKVNICDICGSMCTNKFYNVMVYTKGTAADHLYRGDELNTRECVHEVCPKCYSNYFVDIWRTESEE